MYGYKKNKCFILCKNVFLFSFALFITIYYDEIILLLKFRRCMAEPIVSQSDVDILIRKYQHPDKKSCVNYLNLYNDLKTSQGQDDKINSFANSSSKNAEVSFYSPFRTLYSTLCERSSFVQSLNSFASAPTGCRPFNPGDCGQNIDSKLQVWDSRRRLL